MNRERSSILTIVLACLVAILLVPILVCGGIFLFLGTSVQSKQFDSIATELESAASGDFAADMSLATEGVNEGLGVSFAGDNSDIRMVAWNLESNSNDGQAISEQVSALAGYDVLAFYGVAADQTGTFESILGPEYAWLESISGEQGRLAIGYRTARFETLETQELTEYEGVQIAPDDHSPPLLAQLREKASELTFIVMANVLASQGEGAGKTQAAALRAWAAKQKVPIVAVGAFPFDDDLGTNQENEALVTFMRDGVWKCIPSETRPGTDDSERGPGNAILPPAARELVFVAQGAKDWLVHSEIMPRKVNSPADDSCGEHRPVELRFSLPSE